MSFPANFICALTILFIVFSGQCEGKCGGDGWEYWAGGRKCLKLFPEKTGWTMAEFNCAYQGGHHISVQDLRENEFYKEMANRVGQVWLGAAQFGTSRDYVWSDGAPFGFEHWKNNVRPTYHRGKKCSKMDGRTGEWVQSCCKVPAASICQKPVPRLPGRIEEEDQSGLLAKRGEGQQFEQRKVR